MGGCRPTWPQWRAVGRPGGARKDPAGKNLPSWIRGSLWLLLGPSTVLTLINHSWLRALLSWGSYSNLQRVSRPFKGNRCEMLSKVFLRARQMQAPPSLPTRFIS